MAKISGIVYLIVGGAIAAFAKFVESKTSAVGMIVFFYLGLIFVAIGVFKIVRKLILKDLDTTHNDLNKTMAESLSKIQLNKDLANVASQSYGGQIIIACSKCGTKHYGTSNFCHKCGTPLK